ncbi:MAG: hypothetical protein K2N05_01490 [Muribaculaceae bacterium]|nr:hypothetical protein [Muribaculaceae bacterium]
MKKIIFLILAFLSGAGIICADEIVMRDASGMKGTVKEVHPDKILFRKTGENFDREISIEKVFKIKYDNSTEEIIPTKESVANSEIPKVDYIVNGKYHHVSTEPDFSSFPPASKVYHVGDWYNENGVEGIVVMTTPDGRHGRIVGHKEVPVRTSGQNGWGSIFNGDKSMPLGTNDKTNGYANLQKLRYFQSAHPKYGAEMYPVQTALDKWGPGWYVPSVVEMANLSRLLDTKVNYSGEVLKFKGKNVKWEKIIRHQAKEHNGKFKFKVYALTSTEDFSQGGASSFQSALYGDPQDPQFVVYKIYSVDMSKPEAQYFMRSKAQFVVPFHLF